MAANKVIINDQTVIDLTSDTATAADVASGKTFHKANGMKTSGTADMAAASYSNNNITLTDGFPVQIGGGGGDVDVVPIMIDENGVYTAPSGKAYSPVTVDVPEPSGGDVIQYSSVIAQVKNKTSYTTTGSKITVAESGNYKCSWTHYAYAAGSSSTYATQLYRNGSAVGSAHACPAYNGTSNFVATENSISLTAGQTIEVRARTRSGSNYYTVSGMLVIEKVGG